MKWDSEVSLGVLAGLVGDAMLLSSTVEGKCDDDGGWGNDMEGGITTILSSRSRGLPLYLKLSSLFCRYLALILPSCLPPIEAALLARETFLSPSMSDSLSAATLPCLNCLAKLGGR